MLYMNNYGLNYVIPKTKPNPDQEVALDVREYLYQSAKESCLRREDVLGALQVGRQTTQGGSQNQNSRAGTKGASRRFDAVKFDPIAVLKSPRDVDQDVAAGMMKSIGLEELKTDVQKYNLPTSGSN